MTQGGFKRPLRCLEGRELQFFRLTPFYEGLHRAICDLYGDEEMTLSLGDFFRKAVERVSNAFQSVSKWLHSKKAFTPDMMSEPEPVELINATHDVLAEKLGHLERNIPDAMARALDENIFLFSGFKTYHEMNDASRLLKDEDGGFKPFDRFLQDVQAIDASYNQNWLYAEYNFATASTQMAARWADIERDGDEYDLQYRTALDGLVRPEHAALEGITLPPSDKFWNEYYPPNGWSCRCEAVQVLKDKYPLSDSDKACAAGERATTQIGKNGENRAAMFRFNPGKAGKVFPPKHPYYKAPAEVKKQVNAIVMMVMTAPQKPSAVIKKRVIEKFNKFVDTLPTVQVNGETSHQKTETTANGDKILVVRKFFTEVFSKAKVDMNLEKTIDIAMEFEQWIPQLSTYTKEPGKHHNCDFAVFRFSYKGEQVELKAKIRADDMKAHTLRIL